VEKKEKQEEEFYDKLGIASCNLQEARDVVKLAFECQHVPVLIGEAGCGKTQLARQIAEEMKAKAVFLYLAHREPEDIVGIPYPNPDQGSYKFLTEETMREVLSSKKDVVLVLDEWNRGERQTMNAAFTMVEDRRFGDIVLPERIHIMACMNPSEGNYIVNEAEKDPAFRRRLCFIGVRTEAVIWVDYAKDRFHKMVVNFIADNPHCLVDINAREAGKVYANPAAWEKVSQTLFKMEENNMSIKKNSRLLNIKLAGHIGVGMAHDFITWIKQNNLSPADVLFHYKRVKKGVQELVDKGEIPAIANLIDGIAIRMVSEELDPEKIGQNLANFAIEIPIEQTTALFNKILHHCEKLKKNDYFVNLGMYLREYPEIRKAIVRAKNAIDKIEGSKDDNNDAGDDDE